MLSSGYLDLEAGQLGRGVSLSAPECMALERGQREVPCQGWGRVQSSGLLGTTGAGSTHAWAEVFVSGAGWIPFDPTNRSVGGFNLIPVAVVRDIQQAIPVSGNFVGTTDAFAAMSVEVLVTS